MGGSVALGSKGSLVAALLSHGSLPGDVVPGKGTQGQAGVRVTTMQGTKLRRVTRGSALSPPLPSHLLFCLREACRLTTFCHPRRVLFMAPLYEEGAGEGSVMRR